MMQIMKYINMKLSVVKVRLSGHVLIIRSGAVCLEGAFALNTKKDNQLIRHALSAKIGNIFPILLNGLILNPTEIG